MTVLTGLGLSWLVAGIVMVMFLACSELARLHYACGYREGYGDGQEHKPCRY